MALFGLLLAWWFVMAVVYAVTGEPVRALWFAVLFVAGGLILWRRRTLHSRG